MSAFNVITKLRRKSAAGELKLVHDLVMLWSGQLGSRIVIFLAFAYLARTLSPHAYGSLEFTLGLATLGSVVIEAGIGAIGVRRIARGEATMAEMAALVPATRLALALVVAPAMWLFVIVTTPEPLVVALAGLISLSMLFLPFKQEWLFQSQERMGHILISQLVRAAVFTGGMLLLVRGDRQAVLAGVVEVAAVIASAGWLLVMQARSIAPLALNLRPRPVFGLAREGLYVGLLAMMWPLNQYIPLLLVGSMLGMADTAHFGAAHRLTMALVVFTHLYHFNLYPTFTRGLRDDTDAVSALARASVRVTGWAGVGAALGAALLAEPVMTLLFGQAFHDAALAFSILIWIFPVALLSGHTRWMLVAAGRERDMVVAEVVGAVVILVAGPLLIPRFSGAGAAAAMLASTLSVWIAAQVQAAVRFGHAPWRPAVLPAVCGVLVLAAMRVTHLSDYWATAVGVALFGALMLLLDRQVIGDLARLMTGKRKAA